MTTEQIIVNWYNENKRDLPWRNTKNPYKIWISEIILQQTRVEQGLNYYYKFIEAFPDVIQLANAEEDTVLKYWQGLGYYSRARNLHYSAKYIVNELKGEFPKNFKELKKLKGVGDYTAAAIASFAYNEKVPLVDGNVYRFLSRFYAEGTPIDSLSGKKIFFKLAENLLQTEQAIVFNQAIMEFGALQCKPKPDCQSCPLNHQCMAFSKNEIDRFPVKSKKLTIKKRYFNYLLINLKDSIVLQKRNGNDIWQGLFELPLIESKTKLSLKELIVTEEWKELIGNRKIDIKANDEAITHQLTHQQLFVNFYEIKVHENLYETILTGKNLIVVPRNEIEKYAVPKVIENYLKKAL